MNLCRDVYEIIKIFESAPQVNKSLANAVSIRTTQDALNLSLRAYSNFCVHRAVYVDTLKNVCDLFIPLTALGYTKLNPRTIGLLGVASSMAGLIVMLQPSVKLLPA